ncbi:MULTISPECIES: PPK2 family polyphosphate kinase [Flavobacterium]|jgi:PPK2 family polyphosphate:nucleotide phosphotransferase|uniref:Phosphate--nucleotide phosphotransferase n=1 Tax=Flavobacterium cupriresistens TaxID=2893885 RepID=A0ABU4RHV1_9FLAO|nr:MULTISPECIES: phosphate--nucleotide phosphotransferase [unclassified Flavobacterium]KLT68568.1 phosphate:nucleotide phosphotransferase [Flavobacterium sp. ABG]MDX6191080.1 phosphate--nucleotide phosphotransferase [Flavobacterium sp. Fl-318]UFH42599.1 phosphate--nucleotide phosphotransferase [Flavobacterium sp. F-323]
MKSIDPNNFKVVKKISLKHIPTLLDIKADEDEKEHKLDKVQAKLSNLQDVMYAHNKYGVLICLQGMDTSGKDSLIREVFKEFNPRGVVVHSFKTPTSAELEHDYLWRHYIALPEKGKFAIFNRTHYENVLVTRVHPEYILGENLPGINTIDDITPDFWENRMEQITNFEKHIAQNGTIVLKFFLHLSKEEQRQRLLRRLEEERHHWKFSPADLKERERWDEYQKYYEEAINKTSTEHAPWYIVPADDKEMARYIVAKIIWEEMQKHTDIKEPELDDKIRANFEMYKKELGA